MFLLWATTTFRWNGNLRGKVGELLWGEWVHGGRSRDYRLRPQPVPSGFTIDRVSGR